MFYSFSFYIHLGTLILIGKEFSPTHLTSPLSFSVAMQMQPNYLGLTTYIAVILV